jgi:beta-glucosidase
MSTRSFPSGFLIGVAQSAHQVEGGNVNSDWWEWEHRPGSPCREPSGDACDFYHRYREDVALVAAAGLNAFRLSIEWARIEPAPGEFSYAVLDHYGRVLEACRAAGLATVVTFNHYSLPRWLQERGGFASDGFAALFTAYCGRAAESLAGRMTYASTFNEPEGVVEGGWLLGVNPPGRKGDLEGFRRVAAVLLEAHHDGAAAIRAAAGVPVGVTLMLPDLQYEDGAIPGDHHVELAAEVSELFLVAARTDDWVGVQTYTRNRFGPEGPRGPIVEWGAGGEVLETEATTQLGQELYPQALGGSIRRAWKAAGGTPLLVSESGIATADDDKRIRFVEGALAEVAGALDDAIDVRGYLYWSLLDNFEWSLGYGPTFGLVAVDRATFARRPKPSLAWLGGIARASAASGSASPPG